LRGLRKLEPLRELGKEKLKGKKVLAVMSSKGGVGKSVISALLSLSLPSVTLIDLDIHTMAIAKLFGVEGLTHEVGKEGIRPFRINNVNLVSLSGVVRGGKYVILPGVNQSSVMEELLAYSSIVTDYVVIDMPPGLGDEVLVLERLTDFQPVVVTTPSKVSLKVVNHLLSYLKERGKEKVYVIVNMAYFKCGNEIIRPFGEFKGDLELPIDPAIEDYVGRIHEYHGEVRSKIEEFVKKELM
jgi:Mrp family chromosome partitioning ATPase